MNILSRRPTLLSRLWQKMKPFASTATTRSTQSEPARPRQKPRREIVGIEPLEGRIAPATLIDASTISFTDLDGDQVTVHFSKPLFNQATAEQRALVLEAVFSFETYGTGGAMVASAFGSDGPQQLKLLDLSKFNLQGPKSVAGGVSISIIADQVGSGDGFTTVGRINGTFGTGTTAVSVGLGDVFVDGRLVEIDAGGKDYAYGLKSLVVQNFGPAIPTGANPIFPSVADSTIYGKVGSFTVLENMQHATLQVKHVAGSTGDIEKMSIGGALIGLTTSGNAATYTNSGNITAAGNIGSLTIGSGAAGDGIIGGMGAGSGSVSVGGTIGKLTVDGDLLGGAGGLSGSIFAAKGLGTVQILGDIKVSVTGSASAGFNSATIRTDGGAKSIFVAGNVIGTGASTGGIEVDGVLQSITINGNLEGRSGTLSGFITSDTSIGTVKILGDVKGTDNSGFAKTGFISSTGAIGKITIGGSLIGGAGESSGTIHAGLAGAVRGADIGNLTINGQIIGGSGDFSGSVIGETKLGKIIVQGAGATSAVQGGSGDFSGVIYSSGTIASVTLGKGLTGGAGDASGGIVGHGLIKKVAITGSVVGGAGERSGGIFSFDPDFAMGGIGQLGSVSISGILHGGAGDESGRIHADASISSVKVGAIHRDAAAPGDESAAIVAGNGSGGGRLGSVSVSSDIIGATIRAGFDLGSLTVKGSVTDSVITAVGQAVQKGTKDVAIGKITINGNVSGSEFLAGHDAFGGVNADAQIGKVTVKGNWIASSLVAGAVDRLGDGYGNADDTLIDGGSDKIISRIASVIIGGTVSGTAQEGDHFGFVAEQLGKIKVKGSTFVDLPDVKARLVTAPAP